MGKPPTDYLEPLLLVAREVAGPLAVDREGHGTEGELAPRIGWLRDKKAGGELPPHPLVVCHGFSKSVTPPPAETPLLWAGHLHVNAAGVRHRRIDRNGIRLRGCQRYGLQCKARS